MLALWESLKQQKEQEKCSVENIFQFSLKIDTKLISEKDKYGKTHKRLVELIVVGWWYQIKENKLLCTKKLWKMIT